MLLFPRDAQRRLDWSEVMRSTSTSPFTRGFASLLSLTAAMVGLAIGGCGGDAAVDDSGGGGGAQACRDMFECAGDELCIDGFCHNPADDIVDDGCTVDADCAPGLHCNVLTGTCAEGATTSACDRVCEDYETCNTDTGTCEANASEGCRSSADCDNGEVCDNDTGACVSADDPAGTCQTSADCATGEVCNALNHTCYTPATPDGCQSSADCATGEICNNNTRACERPDARCLSNQDCAAGKVCNTVSGACETRIGCASDAECASNETCNTTTGACDARIDACTSALDCSIGESCQAGRCVAGNTGGCTSDFDCSLSEQCSGGQCVPYGTGGTGGCSFSWDCDLGEYCAAGTCVPGCENDWDCGLYESCIQNACIEVECVDDYDCSYTESCISGACVADGNSGGACTEDALEPNDSFAAATVLTADVAVTATSCGSNVDAYRIALGANCDIDAILTFNGAAGDLDLYLYSVDGTERANSEGVTGEEIISGTAQVTEDFYFTVEPYRAIGGEYTFVVNVACR